MSVTELAMVISQLALEALCGIGDAQFAGPNPVGIMFAGSPSVKSGDPPPVSAPVDWNVA